MHLSNYIIYFMNEIWKSIIGYEGLYEASNLGRIRSLKYDKVRILKPGKDECGYLRVVLYKGGKKNFCKVHRLVAEAFIPNPYNLPEINHRNEIKSDNFVENLEWCTHCYNVSYGTLPQRQSKTQLNDIKKSKPVYQYTLDGVLVRVWPSVNECRRYGFSLAHVAACCRGERKSHKGYIWSYVPLFFNEK